MLLNNEWRYLRRQPLVWVACLILPFVAYLFAVGIGGIDTLADKRLQALHMTLLMMSLPLLIGVLAPLIFLRDQTHNMSELILVTPQSLLQRLFARFVTLFLVCSGLMLLSFFIMWLVLSQDYGFQYSLFVLSLWDFALMALPAGIFYTALACCLAQRFSSNVVIYALFGSLWLCYLVLASMSGAPMLAGSTIASQWLFDSMRLLDPFGNTPLIALYQNSATSLYGDLLFYLNRLLYCLFGVGLFLMSLKRKPRIITARQLSSDLGQKTIANQTYQLISPHPKATIQLWQLSRMALLTLLKQRLSQLILVGWSLLMFSEVLSAINYAEPFSVINPTSLDALNRISDDVLPLLGSFLVLLWSWQLAWRNKQTAMAELIAVAPVRSGILVGSHIIALSVLILLLMLLSASASLVAETIANSEIQLAQYLSQLSKAALSLWVLGALFSVFHAICRSPLTAAAWCAGILVMKYTPLSGKLGMTHTLWNIGASPLQPADAFWGLEQSLSVYWPFMTFWLLVTFTLLWVAGQWSHRTTCMVNNKRWTLSLSSTTLLVLTLLIGFNLHNNIINERPLMSSDLREQWRADYEKKYTNWAVVAQPTISHVDTQVDIFPQEGEAKFYVNYTLENRSNQPIDKLLIGHHCATAIDELKLSVAHTLSFDDDLGQYTVILSDPLAVGDKLHLHSNLTFRQTQYWPAVMPQFIKPTFSYLRGIPILPTVGFQPQYQLRNEQLRQQYGLTPLNLPKPSILFAKAQSIPASYDWVTMHSVVSTNIQQTPLAQGELLKEWQQDGRRYAEYQTKGPIRNAAVWYSLAPTSLIEQQGDVTLAVYSPQINAATELNMLAMKDTLNWMTQHVAAYRGSRLSLLAMPNMGPTGYALPQMITINHLVGFLAMPSPDAGFDQRYRRAVHETAHQWFGHDLGNGVLEDSAFLVESLAKYVELVLLEQRYGKPAMQALVDYERERYKLDVMRSTEQIQALVDATENYDVYSRSTLVFAILREKLGDELITQALRELWQQHAYPQTPATSMDFVRGLKKWVNDKDKALLDNLLLGTDIKMLLE
jgi:ABC-2 type transport system permease protein